MIHAQSTKIIQLWQPDAFSASTSKAVEFETTGFDYATIVWFAGSMQAACTAFKLSEGDVSGVLTDIDAFTAGNAACVDIDGAALALSKTNDNDAVVFQLDLQKRKKFVKFTATGASGGTSAHAAIVILSRQSDIGLDTSANAIAANTGTAVVVRG